MNKPLLYLCWIVLGILPIQVLAYGCIAHRLTYQDIQIPGLDPRAPISGVDADQMGRLWLSTENGVVLFDGVRSFPLRYQPGSNQGLAFPIGNNVVETKDFFLLPHDAKHSTLLYKKNGQIEQLHADAHQRVGPFYRLSPKFSAPFDLMVIRPYQLNQMLTPAADFSEFPALVIQRDHLSADTLQQFATHQAIATKQQMVVSRLFQHKQHRLAITMQDKGEYRSLHQKQLVRIVGENWYPLEISAQYSISDVYSSQEQLYIIANTLQSTVLLTLDAELQLQSVQPLSEQSLPGSFHLGPEQSIWGLLANQLLFEVCQGTVMPANTPLSSTPDSSIQQKSAWDQYGNFWLTKSNGGLARLSVLPEYLQLYHRHNSGLPTDSTRVAKPFDQQHLVVATQDAGVYVIDRQNGKLKQDITPRQGFTGWRDVFIHQDQIWLSGFYGLWFKQGDHPWQQLSQTQSFRLFRDGETVWQLSVLGVQQWSLSEQPQPLQSFSDRKAVRDLVKTSGHLLMARHDPQFPLRFFNQESSPELRQQHDLNPYPFALYAEGDGYFYGSWGGGLNYYQPDKGVTYQLTTADGLPSDLVYGILKDSYQRYWLSTDKGLVVLRSCAISPTEPCLEIIDILTTQQGLLCNEFDSESHFLSEEGILYFGGLCGIVAIDSHLYQPGLPTQKPYMSMLLQQGLPLPNRPPFTLPYHGNDIALDSGDDIKIGFSTADYRANSQLQYQHNQGPWRQLTAPFEVNFLKLPYGKQQFSVQHLDPLGKPTGPIGTVQLHVATPWFATAVAKGGYLLLGMFGFILLYRLRQRQLLMQNKALIQEVAAKTSALADSNLALHNNLQQHQQMVEYLSHELRTPLSLMLLPIQQLEPQLGGKQKQLLQQAERAGQRLHGFIDQLLQLGEHIDFSKQPAVYVDIPTVVQQLVESYQPLALAKQQQLLISGDLGSKTGYWQRQSLEIILSNLLSNAIKHCPLAAVIQVKLSYHKAMLHLQVCDNGTGIAEAEQEVIFEKHQRASTQSPGNGLGLAIVKTLCQQLGGEIKLLPQAQGSCFEVRLPIQEHSAPLQPLTHQPVKALGDKLVLLVEDEPTLRQQLSRGLQNHFTVISAADGEEAWQLIQQQLPDIVISDVQMPKRSGTELCQLVKQHDSTCHIPVLLLSAWASTEHQRSGLHALADDYLTKPIHLDLLLHKVTNLLSTLEAQAIKLQHAIISGNPEDSTKVLAQTSPQSKPERLLNQTRQFIEQQIQQGNGLSLSSQLLAEQANLSEKQLNRYCQQRCQCSLSDLISLSKLRYAAQLLANPALNIAQVSDLAGFSSQAYFSKVFKAQYGKTPGEFRKSHGH